MNVTLRLYWPSDIDLIAVRALEGTAFNTLVRRCMDSCLHGSAYTYHMPDGLCQAVKTLPPSTATGRVATRVGVPIDARRYGDICSFLSGVPRLHRGAIVKAFVRACFSRYPAELLALTGLAGPQTAHGAAGNGTVGGNPLAKQGAAKAGGAKATRKPRPEADASPAVPSAAPRKGLKEAPSYAAPPAAGGSRKAMPEDAMGWQSAGSVAGPDDAFDIFSSMM